MPDRPLVDIQDIGMVDDIEAVWFMQGGRQFCQEAVGRHPDGTLHPFADLFAKPLFDLFADIRDRPLEET
jgi:hypothetical protein